MDTKIEDGEPLTFRPDFKPSNTVPIVSGSMAGRVAFYWDVKAVFQCDLAILRLSPLGGLPGVLTEREPYNNACFIITAKQKFKLWKEITGCFMNSSSLVLLQGFFYAFFFLCKKTFKRLNLKKRAITSQVVYS